MREARRSSERPRQSDAAIRTARSAARIDFQNPGFDSRLAHRKKKVESLVHLASGAVATAIRHGSCNSCSHPAYRALHGRLLPGEVEEGRPKSRERFALGKPSSTFDLRTQRQIRERLARGI